MWRNKIVAAAMASLALFAGGSPASATIVERGEFSGSDSGIVEECGLELLWQGPWNGRYAIRAGTPGSQAFFIHGHVEFRDVFTNPDTGVSLAIRGRLNFQDVKATHLDGDVYHFRYQEAGQVAMESSDGKVVLRESGVIVFDVVFDTLGDDAPGGEVLSFEVAALNGRFFSGDDWCEAGRALIG